MRGVHKGAICKYVGENIGKTQAWLTLTILEPEGMVIRNEWEEGGKEEGKGREEGGGKKQMEKRSGGGNKEGDGRRLLGSSHDLWLRDVAGQQWPHRDIGRAREPTDPTHAGHSPVAPNRVTKGGGCIQRENFQHK